MKIDRMNKGEWGKLRAFFDLKTNEGIVIKGFKLVEGINGLFVGMPSQKDKENDENGNPVYRDTVFMEKEARDQVNDLALEEYNNESSDAQSSDTDTMPTSTSSNESSDDNSGGSAPVQIDEVKTTAEGGVTPFDDNDVPF